jgi:hypothetical protein
MKNLCAPELSRWWTPHPLAEANAPEVRPWGGAFQIPYRGIVGAMTMTSSLRVIASRGDPKGLEESERWDHASVSTATRCPTWEEMEFVKRLFFERDETAMQLHVPPREHVKQPQFLPAHLATARPGDPETAGDHGRGSEARPHERIEPGRPILRQEEQPGSCSGESSGATPQDPDNPSAELAQPRALRSQLYFGTADLFRLP